MHLCKMNAFDEVKSYAVKHGLYPEALNFYRYQEDNYKGVMRLYAANLQQDGKFQEAGIGTDLVERFYCPLLTDESLSIPRRQRICE